VSSPPDLLHAVSARLDSRPPSYGSCVSVFLFDTMPPPTTLFPCESLLPPPFFLSRPYGSGALSSRATRLRVPIPRPHLVPLLSKTKRRSPPTADRCIHLDALCRILTDVQPAILPPPLNRFEAIRDSPWTLEVYARGSEGVDFPKWFAYRN